MRRAATAAGLTGTRIDVTVVKSDRQARTTGFAGSPTFRIGGRDPFAEPGQPPGLSCRLYRTPAGLRPIPHQPALIEAIRHATAA